MVIVRQKGSDMEAKGTKALEAKIETYIALEVDRLYLIDWRKAGAKRTPQEWVELIKQIPDKAVRCQVACIIWWDYFARHRKKRSRWTQLDKYMEQWNFDQKASVVDVRMALIYIGFPEVVAQKRVRQTLPPLNLAPDEHLNGDCSSNR